MLPNHSRPTRLSNVARVLPAPQSTPMSTSLDDAERQPLLSQQQQSVDNSQTIEYVTATVTPDDLPTDDANVTKPDLDLKTHLWTILRYITLAAAGVLILVFFVKGFIDAGDVDVSLFLSHLTSFDILEQFDLKKALKRALGGGLSGAAGNVSALF
jgi:hypothetical protein